MSAAGSVRPHRATGAFRPSSASGSRLLRGNRRRVGRRLAGRFHLLDVGEHLVERRLDARRRMSAPGAPGRSRPSRARLRVRRLRRGSPRATRRASRIRRPARRLCPQLTGRFVRRLRSSRKRRARGYRSSSARSPSAIAASSCSRVARVSAPARAGATRCAASSSRARFFETADFRRQRGGALDEACVQRPALPPRVALKVATVSRRLGKPPLRLASGALPPDAAPRRAGRSTLRASIRRASSAARSSSARRRSSAMTSRLAREAGLRLRRCAATAPS